MKKLMLLAAGIGLSVWAMAQTKVISKPEEKAEIKHDIKVKRAHKKAAVKNLSQLKLKAAAKEQAKVNAKRKEVQQDTKDLRAVGVKHPQREAKKELRQEKKASGGK